MTQASLETYDPSLTSEEGFCNDCALRMDCQIYQRIEYPEYFAFGCYKCRPERCGTCIWFDEHETDIAVRARRRGTCAYDHNTKTYGNHACEKYSERIPPQ